MKKTIVSLLLIMGAVFLCGGSFENGKMVIQGKYEPIAERNWFVTVSGTGGCTGWDDPCTFRTAVEKTSNDVLDSIHVGAGDHNMDNGSDGTGTDITSDNVVIEGMNGTGIRSTTFYNGHATASAVLTFSGDNISIEGVFFNNVGQTDPNVTLLTIHGDYTGVNHCLFVQSPPAASGTGLAINNSSNYHVVNDNQFYGLVDYAIHINGASSVSMDHNFIAASGTGLYVQGATDSGIYMTHSELTNNTLGIKLDNSSSTSTIFLDTHLRNNTDQIDDDCDWGVPIYDNMHVSGLVEAIYPAAGPITISDGGGAWGWGAVTTLVAASTITEPFRITRINITSAGASDLYQIELYYGESSADTSMGTYELYTTKTADIEIEIDRVTPANSIIGARVRTETGGGSLDVTFSYQEF